MSENDLYKKIVEQDSKLDAILKSVEKTRRYFLWTLVATLIVFVLPLIALAFIIPQFLSNYANLLNF
jgi:hypothetical protein